MCILHEHTYAETEMRKNHFYVINPNVYVCKVIKLSSAQTASAAEQKRIYKKTVYMLLLKRSFIISGKRFFLPRAYQNWSKL